MGDRFLINLICCSDVICNEIAQGINQRGIALTYAMAIQSEMDGADKPDWPRINAAILSRWKMSGLERIKRRALDLIAGRAEP